MSEEATLAKLERIPELLAAEPALARRGRFLDADALIGVGSLRLRARFRAGEVALERDAMPMRAWRFAIRADADSWERLWQEMPEPGWHDLLAMTKRGAAAIEGDLQPVMANLQYLKDVLTLPRRLAREDRR